MTQRGRPPKRLEITESMMNEIEFMLKRDKGVEECPVYKTIMLCSEGLYSYAQIAAEVGCSKSTVQKRVERFERQGPMMLKSAGARRRSGRPSRIDKPVVLNELRSLISKGKLKSNKHIGEWLKSRYGIEYSDSSISRLKKSCEREEAMETESCPETSAMPARDRRCEKYVQSVRVSDAKFRLMLRCFAFGSNSV